MKLLTEPIANPKVAKNGKLGQRTYVLHLAPSRLAGRATVCPDASPACLATCLNLAGRGGMFEAGKRTNHIQRARIRKTRFWFYDRSGFLAELRKEIRTAIRKGERDGFVPSFRLNGTSDIAWEKIGIPQEFPGIVFYDYTKSVARYRAFLSGRNWPENYHLVFSRTENNEKLSEQFVRAGGTVTVVFEKAIPSEYRGLPVFNADQTDYRPADPTGVYLGLRFKGRIRKRERAVRTGFAVKGDK